MNTYTVIIATCERAPQLNETLTGLAEQSRPPTCVTVIDASSGGETREIAEKWRGSLALRYERAEVKSAARQRNQGARAVATPLVAFVDDDVHLPPDVIDKLCLVFDSDTEGTVGGVAGRIYGMEHSVPRGLLRIYYRLQAGFYHPTYGGKLFGPAINCLPSYTETGGQLIPADWLNSTCVCYRTSIFLREMFPAFDGYSFLEDVHLSARVGQTHRLYFHRSAVFEHRDMPSAFKRDRRAMAAMHIRNQRRVAEEILGIRGSRLFLKLLLHRLFNTAALLRRRPPEWCQEVAGTWM